MGSPSIRDTEKKPLKKLADIPGPRTLPFFGTTLYSSGFGGKDLLKANDEQVRKYGLLVKQEHFWNYPIIEVYDPDDIEKVLKADKTGFMRPPIDIMVTYRKMRKDKYGNVGMTNEIGDKWHALKAVLTKSLISPLWISGCISFVNDIAEDFVSMVRYHIYDSPYIPEFDVLLQKLVIEVSCNLTVGRRAGSLLIGDESTKLDYLLRNLNGYWHCLHKSYYGFPFWKFLPTKIWKDFVASEEAMYEIAEELTQEILDGNYRDGFCSEYIHSDKVAQAEKVTAVLDFLVAGYTTVVNTLIFTVHWISKFEDVQNKLQEELRQLLPNKDTPIDAEKFKHMHYLKACVKESFRFTPTAPNVARMLDTEIQLRGYNIPAYTILICQFWHNCMQENNFYRAKEFLPERWLGGRDGTEKFWPHRETVDRHFGFGKRMCPGKRFAFQELCILTAKIFRNFRITPHKEMDYSYDFLLSPKTPFSVSAYELEE